MTADGSQGRDVRFVMTADGRDVRDVDIFRFHRLCAAPAGSFSGTPYFHGAFHLFEPPRPCGVQTGVNGRVLRLPSPDIPALCACRYGLFPYLCGQNSITWNISNFPDYSPFSCLRSWPCPLWHAKNRCPTATARSPRRTALTT